MAVSERDMLECAEYFLDILDKAKADNGEEIPNGLGTYSTEVGEFLDRARRLVRYKVNQYIDNGELRRFGPDDPNPVREYEL
jgi:hypothetical protein